MCPCVYMCVVVRILDPRRFKDEQHSQCRVNIRLCVCTHHRCGMHVCMCVWTHLCMHMCLFVCMFPSILFVSETRSSIILYYGSIAHNLILLLFLVAALPSTPQLNRKTGLLCRYICMYVCMYLCLN
jgi:hypothetical protein